MDALDDVAHRVVRPHVGGQALGEAGGVDVECGGEPALELRQVDVAALEVDQRLRAAVVAERAPDGVLAESLAAR